MAKARLCDETLLVTWLCRLPVGLMTSAEPIIQPTRHGVGLSDTFHDTERPEWGSAKPA